MASALCADRTARSLYLLLAVAAFVVLPAVEGAARPMPLNSRGQRPRQESAAPANNDVPAGVDTTPPTVVLHAPEAGERPLLGLSVEAADESGVAMVTISLDGVVVAARTDEPYRFEVAAPRLPVRVKALAADVFGNTASTETVVEGPPEPCACPDIYAPVCGVDGRNYGNACEAECAGVKVAHEGPCEAKPCGADGETCGETQFCEFPAGTCGKTGETGECRERPQVCPRHFDPVCGCDGKTYGNDCERRAAAVSVWHVGPCDEQPRTCAGIANLPCAEGEICDLRDPRCAIVDLAGECVPAPESCLRLWDPVCGCDGKTYANDCHRLQAGAVLAHRGECKPDCTRPPADWSACASDSDCVVVDGIGCCSCAMGGRQGAANREHVDEIERYRRLCCQGMACPAVFLCERGLAAVCENGTCVARKPEP